MINPLKSKLSFTSPLTQHHGYRLDIDGLRAVAVCLVVGFHAFPNIFKGGYIGVDIFFIISGYLISGIIFKQLSSNQFSFWDFYKKRINRIFPALIFVLLSTTLLSNFYSFRNEILDFNDSLIAAVSFVANIFFYIKSGYFDTTAETKPLLHLWSLGIEEQYYIIWPILLMLLWKRHIIKPWSIILLITASFTASIFVLKSNQSAAFYLPQLRFWELLLGSLLAYYHTNPAKQPLPKYFIQHKIIIKNLSSCVGFILIAVCVLFLNKSSLFPGWWALLPTLGSVLIIAAGKDAYANRTLLSNPIPVFIGVISYPVYLWHWPLLSFLHIEMGASPLLYRVIAVVFSFFMGWLTYVTVEKPIRFGIKSNAKTYVLALMLFSLGIYGYIDSKILTTKPIDNVNAFVNHYIEYQSSANLKLNYKFDCNIIGTDGSLKADVNKDCYTPESNKAVFIWGDSHAQHLNFGLSKLLSDNISLLQIASFGCAPNVNFIKDGMKSNCDKANQYALGKIKSAKPSIVVLAQRHGHENNHWVETITALKSYGVQKIIIVGPVPDWQQYLYRYFARHLWERKPSRTKENLAPEVFNTDLKMKALIPTEKSVVYISMLDILCNNQGCLTYLGSDYKNSLVTWDYGHLTLPASEYVARNAIGPAIKNDLQH
ncbi:MAG: acyltransferase family protein [Methylotenera sp.]|uniref:acyltransferase family protein n=1 Tax=Methylotenera sp. TaxID=2051956 RepID=UPI002489D3DF|nr:acyltransferase family protein [Methylotenera sp.]MDI1310114.1 acyltransferase family protein [Methylotenera sp.]